MSEQQELIALFTEEFGHPPLEAKPLSAHASDRKMVRLSDGTRSVIGVSNPNVEENKAFIAFTRHFRTHNLPVPEILAERASGTIYLESDLGDETLYDLLHQARSVKDPFPTAIEKLYCKVVAILPDFQVRAARNLDFSLCYQDRQYGKASMLGDMHYFRDSYLVRSGVSFDRDRLEHDFQAFADYLCQAPDSDEKGPFFLYRDFQSRNIMVKEGKPFFIDYQSGRRGPLQYDIASLLYQSKAAIPESAREKLLACYVDALKAASIRVDTFLTFFYPFVLMRLLQVLATYAKHGLSGGKDYFTESIPYARRNLGYVLQRRPIPPGLSELERVCNEVGDQ